MEAIDTGIDACFLLGYHQREAGGDGVLNHTIHGRVVDEVRLNGLPVGEVDLNAWLAGSFGVPVALVSGDDQVCADAQRLLPGVVTAPVKQAIDRFAALTLTPEQARSLLAEQTQQALTAVGQGRVKPLGAAPPSPTGGRLQTHGLGQHGPTDPRHRPPGPAHRGVQLRGLSDRLPAADCRGRARHRSVRRRPVANNHPPADQHRSIPARPLPWEGGPARITKCGSEPVFARRCHRPGFG
jgi:D-aminopeptidase